MAYKLTVKGIETIYSQASNEYFMDVEVAVFNDDVEVESKRFGYPLDTSSEAVLEDLAKVEATLNSDAALAEKSAALEAGFANANKVRETLLKK